MHFLYGFTQAPKLHRRKRANEILFFQEIEEADVVPVLAGALPVDEMHIAAHVVRQGEAGAAVWAHEPIGQRRLWRRRVVTDQLHQLQRRSRSQPQVLVALKPERFATSANVNVDFHTKMPGKLPGDHGGCDRFEFSAGADGVRCRNRVHPAGEGRAAAVLRDDSVHVGNRQRFLAVNRRQNRIVENRGLGLRHNSSAWHSGRSDYEAISLARRLMTRVAVTSTTLTSSSVEAVAIRCDEYLASACETWVSVYSVQCKRYTGLL